jgi:hypothetical protein
MHPGDKKRIVGMIPRTSFLEKMGPSPPHNNEEKNSEVTTISSNMLPK